MVLDSMSQRPQLTILPPRSFDNARQPVRLTCLRCDREQQLSLPCRNDLTRCLRLNMGFEVKVAVLELTGYCSECQGQMVKAMNRRAH